MADREAVTLYIDVFIMAKLKRQAELLGVHVDDLISTFLTDGCNQPKGETGG